MQTLTRDNRISASQKSWFGPQGFGNPRLGIVDVGSTEKEQMLKQKPAKTAFNQRHVEALHSKIKIKMCTMYRIIEECR